MFFGCLHCVVQRKAVGCGVNHSIWEPVQVSDTPLVIQYASEGQGKQQRMVENLSSYTQVEDLEEVSGSLALAWPSSGFGAIWGVNQ